MSLIRIGLSFLKNSWQSTVENCNSEEASWKVAWCIEHFSLWRLKCFEIHTALHDLHEPNTCLYLLVCKISIFSCTSQPNFSILQLKCNACLKIIVPEIGTNLIFLLVLEVYIIYEVQFYQLQNRPNDKKLLFKLLSEYVMKI